MEISTTLTRRPRAGRVSDIDVESSCMRGSQVVVESTSKNDLLSENSKKSPTSNRVGVDNKARNNQQKLISSTACSGFIYCSFIFSFFLLNTISITVHFGEGNSWSSGSAFSQAQMLEPASSHTTKGFDIDLNPNCVLADDVVSIRHDENTTTVSVELKKSARCSDPMLRGRLSGPYLSIIEWDKNDGSNVIRGKYSVPKPGVYFLEIIVLLCHELTPNHMASDAFTTDTLVSTCLEDPHHHRMTAPAATISVTSTIQSDNMMGFWKSTQPLNNQTILLTRFQPQQCRGENRSLARCAEPMSYSRFEPYTFEWNRKKTAMEDPERFKARKDSEMLCVMGASHSKVLNRKMIAFSKGEKPSKIFGGKLKFRNFILVRYPEGFNNNTVFSFLEQLQGCTALVTGFGQWDASKDHIQPTLPLAFEQKMDTLLGLLKDTLSTLKHNCRLFLRSMHYNPMGDLIGDCLPKDWRTPFLVDGYNFVLRRVAAKHEIPFLDTNFIVSPMWDSSPDLNHLDNHVGMTEALYILNEIVGVWE